MAVDFSDIPTYYIKKEPILHKYMYVYVTYLKLKYLL